jgi:MFS family permease
VQLIPSGLLLLGILFVRESPRWLFLRGRREQAIQNLCWIRQLPVDHIYMIEEIGAIDQSLEQQRSTIGLGFTKPFLAVWSNKRIMYRLFLGSMLFLWQNGSGINAINYYSPTVFKSIGLRGANTSLLTTGIFGVVKTVVTFVWLLWLIDRLGRRLLLMIGAAGGSVCLWIVGAYIKVAKPTERDPDAPLDGGGIAAMFFFYLWTVFYTPSWNGTPWVMNSVCPRAPAPLSLCDKLTDNRKCSIRTSVPWRRPAPPVPTGCGTFSSRASRRRCSPRWSTACTFSSRR